MAVSDQSNSLQVNGTKADNIVIDLAHLSHITNKEFTANSKLTLQRSLSRKTSPVNDNEKTVGLASPRSTLGGASMLEKPIMSPTDRAQTHHQITVNCGGRTENKSPAKRSGLRRSQPSWGFDPRKMFFFMATLSSMGTILLIYFTLSISKPIGDDGSLN